MFLMATLAVLVTMAMTLIRALLGPTIYDRVLAVNTFGTATVLLIAVLGFLIDRPDFLDLALVYALINFIGTIAALKFLKFRDLGTPGPSSLADEE
ncbi:MAG: monovalent cation/H+ antiporter complex subunit F [Kiloniellales bacterium]|nr:monovalent cation/H+ antiporter complex subunit F [Kiloniellales bacterium]